jgi:hypothetical protein
MVRVVTEREARTQYTQREDGKVLAYSLKCASTFLQKAWRGIRRIGQAEAYEQDNPVILFIRHPLDRLVSNYVFWRTVNRGSVRARFPDMQLPEDLTSITIEEWYDYTQRQYDAHWADQVEYHTYKGNFVPTIVYPFDALSTMRAEKVNASKHDAWPTYFTDEFRAQMEARYAEDLACYDKALDEWNGERPPYL